MTPNEEHIKALEFVAKFKESNKETVERVKSYDPAMKMWIFEKVKIDDNAKLFSEVAKKKK